MRSHTIPSLDDVLDPKLVPHYPYLKDFESAKTDPYVILHTSGSTGLPKPIICSQETLCTPDSYHNVPRFEGRDNTWEGVLCYGQRSRFFCSLPFFHCGGLVVGLAAPAFFGGTAVFGPPGKPLSARFVDGMIDHGKVDRIACPASILEDVAKNEDSLEKLRKLKAVVSGAGKSALKRRAVISANGDVQRPCRHLLEG